MTQDNANHDAVPAAIASVESVVPQPTTHGDSDRTDKAAPRPSEGTGNTNARLAALEELSALDQELELKYGIVGNPMIKAQEHMRSQNCCYCETPHGKSFPLIFQSCDACQDARDKRATDASNGLISVSCPRCDLQFSADATHSLTDEEREAIKWAAVVSEGLCQMGAMNRARVLLGILERLG